MVRPRALAGADIGFLTIFSRTAAAQCRFHSREHADDIRRYGSRHHVLRFLATPATPSERPPKLGEPHCPLGSCFADAPRVVSKAVTSSVCRKSDPAAYLIEQRVLPGNKRRCSKSVIPRDSGWVVYYLTAPGDVVCRMVTSAERGAETPALGMTDATPKRGEFDAHFPLLKHWRIWRTPCNKKRPRRTVSPTAAGRMPQFCHGQCDSLESVEQILKASRTQTRLPTRWRLPRTCRTRAPEYWENHRDGLDLPVTIQGVDSWRMMRTECRKLSPYKPWRKRWPP